MDRDINGPSLIRVPDWVEKPLGRGSTGSFMLRGQGWKYIRYGRGPGQEFLYHLPDDPGETRNLADDPHYAAKAKELFEEIDAWLHQTGWPR